MKDAYYFPHDANARHDPRIAAALATYDKAYQWYFMLIEMMREQSEYKLRINGKHSINVYARELQCTSEEIKKFIQDCTTSEEEEGFELFETDGIYFWSKSLNKRMEKLEEVREKRRKAGIKSGEARRTNVEQVLNKNEQVKKSKVSKVKKSKVSKDDSKTDIVHQKAKEILEYYIKLTGKTRIRTIPNEVNARLGEGHTVEEGKKVILFKFLRWWDNPDKKEWVNLTTLFRPSHFEEYLSQAEQGLEQMLLQAYKNFQKKFYDENMNKPLEVRKSLKLPTFEEFKQNYAFIEDRMNGPPW